MANPILITDLCSESPNFRLRPGKDQGRSLRLSSETPEQRCRVIKLQARIRRRAVSERPGRPKAWADGSLGHPQTALRESHSLLEQSLRLVAENSGTGTIPADVCLKFTVTQNSPVPNRVENPSNNYATHPLRRGSLSRATTVLLSEGKISQWFLD